MIDRIATKEAEQLVAEGKYKTIEEALSQAEKDCNARNSLKLNPRSQSPTGEIQSKLAYNSLRFSTTYRKGIRSNNVVCPCASVTSTGRRNTYNL